MEDVLEGDDGEIRRSNRLERLLRQQMAGKTAAVDAVAVNDPYAGGVDDLHKRYSDSFRPMSAQNSMVSSKHSIGSSEQELTKYLGASDVHQVMNYNHRVAAAVGGPFARSRSVDALNKDTDGSYSITYRSPDSTPTPSGRHNYSDGKLAEYDKTPAGYGADFPPDGVLTSTPSGDYKPPAGYHGSHDQDSHGEGYASSVLSMSSVPTSLSGSEDPRREIGYLEQSQGSLYCSGSHQPSIRTPLVTTRTTLATRPNVTDREDTQRMRELDETITSLQRKLNERDRDLHIITRERCHLSEELQRLRQIYETPTEGRDQNEKRINQLIQEKENLATEVWKLKCQLEEMKQNIAQVKTATDDQASLKLDQNGFHDNHLDSYDPNNPNTLHRKIEDLQSQMRDVNEAHESTVNKLSLSENEITKLKEDNRSLRMALRNRSQELDEENIRLRDQITHLQEEDGEFLKRELAEVRHELQVLRNKNHQLMQDNIKLTEHLRRVDTRVIHSSTDRLDTQNRMKSPAYDTRRPDPLLSEHPSNYTSTKVTKLDNDDDDDEQFFRDRHRLTQELRQIAAPQKWSERDFRNHGGEGPYIRAANHDPYSRAKSAPPTRRRETYEDGKTAEDVAEDRRPRHMTDEIHKDRHDMSNINRHQHYHEETKLRERCLERLPQQPRDSLDYRTRPQESRLLNGYHAPLSQCQHERHLSETSSATIELTRACPLGESQNQPSEMMNDFHHSQVPTSNGSPQFGPNSSNSNHLTSDLIPPRKHFEPIDDVLDSLNKPPTTRCHLKVDLVDDVLNGMKPIAKQAQFKNFSDNALPNMVGKGQVHHTMNASCDQSSTLAGHSLHDCSSGTQNSTVDDLLDASIDDPGYVRHQRRDSLDSCSTDVILRAADEMNQLNFEKSPASCDPRVQSGGLRSVSPRPVVTQRNKGSLGSTISSKRSSCSYATKRPFAPRTPADVNVGDVVKFCRHGGKISKGVVKYIGHLPGKHDTYLGLELEHEMAKHDGVYEGVRYFQSKPNRGVFVAFSKVVMAWGE